MKILINEKHGGFDLSQELVEWLIKERNWIVTEMDENHNYINPVADFAKLSRGDDYSLVLGSWSPRYRTSQDIFDGIEALGLKRCETSYCRLKIIEIPDDVDWIIEEYDGAEWVAEKHRTWS